MMLGTIVEYPQNSNYHVSRMKQCVISSYFLNFLKIILKFILFLKRLLGMNWSKSFKHQNYCDRKKNL